MSAWRWVVLICGALVCLSASTCGCYVLCFYSLLPPFGGGWWGFVQCSLLGFLLCALPIALLWLATRISRRGSARFQIPR